MRTLSILTVVLCSLLGASSAPIGTMTPPIGWQAAPLPPPHGEQIFLDSWLLPSGPHPQMIQLLEGPLGEQTFAAWVKDTVDTLGHTGSVSESHAEKICDGTIDAWFIGSKITLGQLSQSQERVLASSRNQWFLATYGRPLDQAENVDARKALDTLCIK